MGLFSKDGFERRVPTDKELRAESFKKNSSDKKATAPKPVKKYTGSSYDAFANPEVKKAEPAKPIFTPAPSQTVIPTPTSTYTSTLFKTEEKKVEEKKIEEKKIEEKPAFVPAPVKVEEKKVEEKKAEEKPVFVPAFAKVEEKKIEEKPAFVPLNQDNTKKVNATANFKQPTSSVYKPTKNRNRQRDYVVSEPSAISSAASVIKIILTIISVGSILLGIGSRIFVETNRNQQKKEQAVQAVTIYSMARIDMMRIYMSNDYSRKELRDAFNEETTYGSVDPEVLINDYVENGEFDFFDKACSRLQSIIDSKSDDFKKMSDKDIEKSLKAAGFEAPEIQYAIDQYHLAEGKA